MGNEKIKKSITLNRLQTDKLIELSNYLGISENAVVAVALNTFHKEVFSGAKIFNVSHNTKVDVDAVKDAITKSMMNYNPMYYKESGPDTEPRLD